MPLTSGQKITLPTNISIIRDKSVNKRTAHKCVSDKAESVIRLAGLLPLFLPITSSQCALLNLRFILVLADEEALPKEERKPRDKDKQQQQQPPARKGDLITVEIKQGPLRKQPLPAARPPKEDPPTMNSHATATQNGQTTVVGHHRGFSQPSVTVAAGSATGSTAGDPWFLQTTGHQMPPTAPLRHNKRPAPQPNAVLGAGGTASAGGSAIGAVLLHQQQLSQSQPHIVPPSIPPHHHHHRDNNVVGDLVAQ